VLTMNFHHQVGAGFKTSGRDLVVTSVETTATLVVPGSTISVTDTTSNIGAFSAGASTTRYYLARDPYRGPTDRLLTGNRAVASLAPGASSMGTATVTVPSTMSAGRYWLIVCADDLAKVVEGDETNNCNVGPDVEIAGADLTISALSVTGTEVGCPTCPRPLSRPGGKVHVIDTTANNGTLSAAASTTRFYLSLDATKGAEDILLTGTRLIETLAPGGASTAGVPIVLTIPTTAALGTYRVFACADDLKKVIEVDETNNCLATSSELDVTLPDLQSVSISLSATNVLPGGKITITDVVTNIGAYPLAVTTTTKFYLSTSAERTAASILLTGKRSLPYLASGQSSQGVTTVTVAAGTPLNTYYVLACADDTTAVLELSESNNCIATPSAIMAVGRPDLIVTTLSAPPVTIALGQTFGMIDTVRNSGQATAAASSTRYYLSLDAVKSTTDYVWTTPVRPAGTLAPGASSAGSVSLKIPVTALGDYYVIACADDLLKVLENDEANNCLSSSATVRVTAPDLQVWGASGQSATLNRGAKFSVDDFVINWGTSASPATTTAASLVAADGSGYAYPVLGTRMVPGLAAGDFNGGTKTVTVLSVTPNGYYYVRVCADSGKKAVESDESNNCLFATDSSGYWVVITIR
jgi:subtilase family serine protease